MDSISALQKSFSKSIRLEPDQHLLDAIVDDGIPAVERLDIHRNTMAITLKTSLMNVFPVTQRLVGGSFFDMMASAFLERHPPTSGALIDWGGEFPNFIKSFNPARMLPYLGDVAGLEWAWHLSFHGGNSIPLKPEVLNEIPEGKMAHVKFTLAPTYHLLSSQYPIVKIWENNIQALKGGEEGDSISLDEGADRILVIRPELDVQVYKLDPGAFDVLRGLSEGKSLNRAYEEAVLLNPRLDLGTLLNFFMQNGFFTNVSY